jgi:5'-nucleotidase
MKVLISNDDGILAPGITVLSQEIARIADIEVVAPDRNRSGASNSLSLLHPLRVKQLSDNFYSVDGTPTDCVHLALTGYFKNKFDLIVSGINDGANLGDDVLYSGTIAAAMEGCNLGLPAIAVSMVGSDIKHYQTAAAIASQIAVELVSANLPPRTMLNINVPDLPINEIRGIEITRLGTRHNAESTQKLLDPRGREIYWIGQPGKAFDSGPGTDFHAVNNGYVSVTPIQLDMTNYKSFANISSWIDKISLKS